MDSSKIKALATGARDALRAEVSGRLDALLAEGSAERISFPEEVARIEAEVGDPGVGREAVVDSAAYTWFNRLCALRFMDANSYTPVGVVTPREGASQPAVLADAAQGVYDPELEVSQEVRERVAGLLSGAIPSANAAEDAYAELLMAACGRYAGPMPYLFAPERASRLLMPKGLLAEGSILRRIAEAMGEEECSSVEVLGWLYQHYIAERKDAIYASGKKREAADIAPVTQLFTPEWIVRYLCENSVGRLWMLNNPGSSLAGSMEYYIAPEGDEPHVEVLGADEVKVLDPACGSGHILVYAFDLLFAMYEEDGYAPEDIPEMILRDNLFGYEIDQRAAEIASFALEMKARERDPRFFEKDADANVHVLRPVRFDASELEMLPLLSEEGRVLEAFAHLDEVGSLYAPDPSDRVLVENELENVRARGGMFAGKVIEKLELMLEQVDLLSRKFSCVVANPPYMGGGDMGKWMSAWLKERYPDEKSDLCTCFMERAFGMLDEGGCEAMVTMQSWMFLGSYEKMRKKMLRLRSILSVAHIGVNVFQGLNSKVVSVVAAVLSGSRSSFKGHYARLLDFDPREKACALASIVKDGGRCCWRSNASGFGKIPGSPIAYWAGEPIRSAFAEGDPLSSLAEPRVGLQTGKNALFVRLWWEVSQGASWMECPSIEQSVLSGKKWFPYNKGGDYRKWYGNNDCVIDWFNDGESIRSFEGSVIRNPSCYFNSSITWSKISSGSIAFRYKPAGHVFDVAGTSIFADERTLKYLQGACNSSLMLDIAKMLSPTLNFEVGQIATYPIIEDEARGESVASLVDSLRGCSKADWDSFETSWDFSRHPMLPRGGERALALEDAFGRWKSEVNGRFDALRASEEELNRIFAEIYGMEGEVPIGVEDKYVSVARVFDSAGDIPESFKGNKYVRTAEDEARSIVSYGVGCLLGRYCADEAYPGLILADQGSTIDDFNAKATGASFVPDADGILPVTDSELFEDDAVAQLKAWIASVWGEDVLDANVAWLESALGKSLRDYLVKDFCDDHVRLYQKRPIYWMFSSPKKGFQALVYMHRYNEGTVGDVMSKYLRPCVEKLRAEAGARSRSDRASDVKKADKLRARVAELEAWERDVLYDLAHERVSIDLDDGVKVNYNKFPKALRKVAGLSDWK